MARNQTPPPKRITGRRLQAIRAAHFSRDPLCAKCRERGRASLATQLDHKVALVNGGQDFDVDPDNAQGLCDPCHVDKTAEDLGIRRRPQVGRDGWPVDEAATRGVPLLVDHPQPGAAAHGEGEGQNV
jgi:5-methylcytosine-specific restriction protein A